VQQLLKNRLTIVQQPFNIAQYLLKKSYNNRLSTF